MTILSTKIGQPWLPLAIACALLSGGCAGLRFPRCPRIDPTGERCLIWPKDEPPAPTAVTPIAASPLPTVPGNVTAPPVTTDPVFPAPEIAPPVAAAPGVVVAPISTPISAALAGVPQDKLTLTPERVLAPVGSEVVLKANVCTSDGYTLAEQKIEWMLARDGVGEFVEVGGKGAFHPPLYPWNRGTKTDNYLATGYTANGPHCITRGTPDPADDVNILRGDNWISVTSPREGTSRVTAYAPTVESWELRRRSATIYWVDVQWTFPPGTITSGGRETLTTLVTRQTDGAPLAGWIVRYEVIDAGGSLAGGGTGQVQEIVTDAEGRAAVQVSPTASGAASSRIDIQLIRPANFVGSDAPRLVVGSSTTIVNWSGGSTYLPPATSAPASPITPVTPPIASPAPAPITPSTPPPSPPGQPRLEFDVQGAAAQVGGQAPLRLTIRNVGNALATQMTLADQFDPGLSFPARPTSSKIEKTIGTLAPGATYEEVLPFQAGKAGELCHRVTLSYAEGAPIERRACITVTAAPQQREAGLKVDVDGPLQAEQGQTVKFKITVKNVGQVPLVNVQTREEYPPAVLSAQPTEQNVDVVSGAITRNIARLDVGQQRQFEVNCLCRLATSTVVLIRGAAETDPPGNRIETADEHALEILQARGQPGAGVPPAGGGAAQSLAVRVSFVNPPVRVGARATCEVLLKNNANLPQERVALQIFLPAQLTPDLQNLAAPMGVQAQMVGEALRFTPIATLNAGETVRYVIPVNPQAAGIVSVTAQAVSNSLPTGVTHTENLEIVGNRL